MKHEHYDMIVAKAENMDLIQFVYNNHFEKWVECAGQEDVRFVDGGMYFLCLPKHKEACLHWLNGGDIDYLDSNEGWVRHSKYTESIKWNHRMMLVDPEEKFRIKPRKEKRCIAVTKQNCVDKLFDTKTQAKEFVAAFYPNNKCSDFQLIEIEVEV